MAQHKLTVRMGEGVVADTPHIILSEGLGSCVVVIIYDTRWKIGGLAHIMLPDSSQLDRQRPPYHCADTAIATLLQKLCDKGAARQNMVFKMVGGAQMFAGSNGSGPEIGRQNIASIKQIMEQEKVPLIGEDTGGNCGRKVEFHLDSGRVIVRGVGRERVEL